MGLFDSIFGKKAEAPRAIEVEDIEFNPADVGTSTKKALDAIDVNFEDIEDVLANLNEFQTDQALKARESVVPGFRSFQESLGNTFNQLQSDNIFELPDSFKDVLNQEAAERGVSGGFGGSEFGDFDAIRNFGREAFAFADRNIQNSQNILNTLVSTAPNVNPISPLNFLVNPSQVFSADVSAANTAADLDKTVKLTNQGIRQEAENIRAANTGKEGLLGEALGIAGGIAFGPTGAKIGSGIGEALEKD